MKSKYISLKHYWKSTGQKISIGFNFKKDPPPILNQSLLKKERKQDGFVNLENALEFLKRLKNFINLSW